MIRDQRRFVAMVLYQIKVMKRRERIKNNVLSFVNKIKSILI